MDSDVLAFTLLKDALVAAVGWLIAFGIRAWWRAWRSKLCRSGHKKKFTRVFLSYDWHCPVEGHPIHGDLDWVWAGEWFCEEPGCLKTAFDCFGTVGEFKIEFGAVVIDEKAMANPQKRKTPRLLKEEKNPPKKELTFDDVFRATEQAMLKNAKEMMLGGVRKGEIQPAKESTKGEPT
jgi:hypothetical protein